MKVIVVSGIIGAGKTTFINLIGGKLAKEGYKIVILKEPVEEWKASGLLEQFYADPKRWGYTFQTEAFRSRIMAIKKTVAENPGAEILLMERGPWDDQIFMEMLHDDGTINHLEWTLYRSWCDLWEELIPVSPDLFILLDPSVETCQGRVKTRGRPGEDKISDSYQTKLKACHDKFFTSGNFSLSGEIKKGGEDLKESVVVIGNVLVPCYRIPAEENFKTDVKCQENVVELFKKIVARH